MKTTVVIAKMNGQETNRRQFITEKQTVQFFYEWCDEHGYEYVNGSTEAGGIGHDYRITIEETEVSNA